ncbi:MAG: PIG-L family deacetylase, partial [Clostridia bacterium]|nr:PIG-L family deacetylase [Clostridia bacterium]
MLTFLMIGAHPDDMDLNCGGTAIRLQKLGHRVIFLSMTNGNAGHMTMTPEELRSTRMQEMKVAAQRFGGIR